MNYLTKQIVFQEIPEEISLSYLITGCRLGCIGCHSTDSWSSRNGTVLTTEEFLKDLKKYCDWVTCILFMGGEWHQRSLCDLLDLARKFQFKTALYTGEDRIEEKILNRLDYLKTGKYQKQLGGLDSINTNQKLIEVKTGRILNSLFIKHTEVLNDTTY